MLGGCVRARGLRGLPQRVEPASRTRPPRIEGAAIEKARGRFPGAGLIFDADTMQLTCPTAQAFFQGAPRSPPWLAMPTRPARPAPAMKRGSFGTNFFNRFRAIWAVRSSDRGQAPGTTGHHAVLDCALSARSLTDPSSVAQKTLAARNKLFSEALCKSYFIPIGDQTCVSFSLLPR